MQLWRTPFVSDAHAAAQPAGDGAAGQGRQRRPGARHLRLPVDGPRWPARRRPTAAVYEDAGRRAATARLDPYHWLGRRRARRPARPRWPTSGPPPSRCWPSTRRSARSPAQAAEALDEAAARVAALVRRRAASAPRRPPPGSRGSTELRQRPGPSGDPAGHAVRRPRPHRRARRPARPSFDGVGAARGRLPRRRRRLRRPPRASSSGCSRDVERDRHRRRGRAARRPPRRAGRGPGGRHRGRRRTSTSTDATVAHRDPGARRRGPRRRQPGPRHPRRPPPRPAGPRGHAPSSPPSSRCSARPSPGRWPPPTRPRRCDEQLGRLLLQLEDLESRFAEFDDFLAELGDQARPRSTRRSPPASRRCWTSAPAAPASLADAAERILDGVAPPRRRARDRRRGQHLLRLRPDGAPSSAASPTSCAPSATASAPRSWTAGSRPPARRPRAPCATAPTCTTTAAARSGSGAHRFAVNTQPLDLTLVPHGDAPRLRPHRHRLPRAGHRR